MSHSHSHYLRTVHPLRESVVEYIRDDSRQKILLRITSEDGLVEVLIDPEVWRIFEKNHTISALIDSLPSSPTCIPPIFLQVGPTCGLYAMKMVHPQLSVADLLRTAQQMNMTAAGEMFCAHDWAKLACHFGMSATVVQTWMIPRLFLSGRRGVAAVPYDSDSSGISYRKGENAHWCVVWKLWEESDQNMNTNIKLVLMNQSSSPLPMVEKWSELEASNRQLIQATVRVDPNHVHFLEARCLAGFTVWIDT